MLTEKPNSVVITVRDRKENKSKSITVYGANVQEVYEKIEKLLTKEK
jgi:hypothetical protein